MTTIVRCTTAEILTAVVTTILIWPVAHADVTESSQTMAAECQALVESGAVRSATARECISACSRVELAKDPATAEATLKQCEDAHAELIAVGNAATTQQTQTRRRSTTPAATPEVKVMADIEGTFLQSNRSGYRVRVEGREDWQTYCNEAARLETGDDEFARTVKAYDRVRFTAISYDPTRVNTAITRCIAKSAVILGAGSP